MHSNSECYFIKLATKWALLTGIFDKDAFFLMVLKDDKKIGNTVSNKHQD